MKHILTFILLLASLTVGSSQSLPSIWRIPYTSALLQFNVVFEFCADGRVTIIQTGPGTLPNCKVGNWWRFGDELLIKSILSEMTAVINQSNPAQPFLQNIQLTPANDILLLYPANTQPNAFFYPVSLAQLAAYKQIGGCPVVPQCPLVNWSTSPTAEQRETTLIAKVAPNPVQDQVNISFSESSSLPLRINITDVSGKLLFQVNPAVFTTVDVSALSSGVYFIHIYWQQTSISQRLIKM